MAHYGSGGSATRETNASGFRLLAVADEARGMGVGRALVLRCLELARERQHGQVILHTTNAMKIAWKLYEDLGFAALARPRLPAGRAAGLRLPAGALAQRSNTTVGPSWYVVRRTSRKPHFSATRNEG